MPIFQILDLYQTKTNILACNNFLQIHSNCQFIILLKSKYQFDFQRILHNAYNGQQNTQFIFLIFNYLLFEQFHILDLN